MIEAVNENSPILIQKHHIGYAGVDCPPVNYSALAFSATYCDSGPNIVICSASNAAKSNRMRNSSSIELTISNMPKELTTPLRKKSKVSGTSTD